MTKLEKANKINDLVIKIKDHNFYVTDTSGFTVHEINKFRRMCHKEKIKFEVVKNTLLKKALEKHETDYSELYDALKGFSGIMFIKENGNVPAKVIKSFKKQDAKERNKFKAASIDMDIYFGEEYLDTLVKLKSKQELIGDLIKTLSTPLRKVVNTLNSGQNILFGLINSISEKNKINNE